jgi:hypothetical protein
LSANDFEILVVRKSGPVQNMTIKKWWISFVLIVVFLTAAVLAAGSYMFYRQYLVVEEMLEDNKLLTLRTERMEALMLEQETREILVSQQQQSDSRIAAPQTEPTMIPIPSAEQVPETDEPSSSSILSIRNMEQRAEQGDMRISFDIVKEQDGNEPAMGYIVVVARGQRAGNPWIEAWPPMRLNPFGRPEQYRRGTPFSVQRFRPIHARIAFADKTFERIEILLYSRQGELILVNSYPVSDLGQNS